jgi:tetratricopeptide (TPR) repeat protein
MAAWGAGSRFGDLEIVRELGRGAFGSVYLARDLLVGRLVALKLLLLPGTGLAGQEREAALREARAVARIKSPNVATLYRVHPLPEGWAFEFEYVESGSLEDLLAKTPRLPAAEAHRIVHGILKGLADAHEQGVVHGDVKPGNVLLGHDGTVKLVDFGLAHLVGELPLRAAGAEVVGTPAYMAPETIMGEPPGAASDLWSVGVILYRMLVGRLPFTARTLPTLLPTILNASPAPLEPGLPPHLADLALRCLAKSPRERPHSCAEALHELSPLTVAEARPPVHPRADRGPTLFGRAPERARLDAAAARAAGGVGTALLITGELGVGTSALAADLAARAASLGFRWVEARLTALEGLARPLLGSLRDLLARPEATAIETGLFGTATNLLRTLVEESGPVPIESRQQIAWGVAELLMGLAQERPLGVLVEDAHLANEEDWNLLRDLARRISATRVLLCVVARAGAAAPPPAFEGAEHLQVGPLDTEALARLLHDRADGARIAPETLRRLLEASEGNPLFAIELLRHLRESGAVVRREDVLVPGPSWGKAALPRRLRELALARLRELPEEQRALIDVAAVDGVAFDGEGVAAGAGRPLLDVLRALQETFRRTGLIVPLRKGYRFAHAVLQEAAYEELAPALRRALHARLAEHLEGRAKGDALPERLGLHWERAGEPARAAPHYLRAAREALQRQDGLRATELLARAGLEPKAVTPEIAAEHRDLLLLAMSTYAILGRHEESDRLFRALDAAAQVSGNETWRLETLVRRAELLYRRQGLVGVDEAALDEAARVLAPSEHRGRANYLLGVIAKYRGDLEEAERRLHAADGDFVRFHPGMHSSALDQLGSVSLRRGRWREAEALYADAARISYSVGRRPNGAVSEVNSAAAAFQRGAVDGLAPRVARAVHTLHVEGASGQVAGALALLSEIQYALGDRESALRSVNEALRTAREAGALAYRIMALARRAELHLAEGRIDAARTDLDGARRLAAAREDYRARLDVLILDCQAHSVLGDLPAARASAAAALRLLAPPAAPAAHESAFLALLEATLYGLPAEALAHVDALLPSPLARSLCAAARAWKAPGGAGSLLEAAALLRGPDVGPRRAALRLVAACLAAEGHLRDGDEPAACREAEAGLRDAAALGHVWMELKLLHVRARLAGGEDARLRRMRRVHEVAGGVSSAAEQLRLLDYWLA